MLLTLGTHAGFTRRTLSPKGEDLLQLRRLRFLSGCVPERSMSPVRNLSSNIATTGSSLKVKGSTLNSLVPESPNLFSLELPDHAQPPEPPDPPDAPSELQYVPSSTTPAPVSLDMTYPSSPPISTDLCGTRARTFPSRSRRSSPPFSFISILHLLPTSITAMFLLLESKGPISCRQASIDEESSELQQFTGVLLSIPHGSKNMGWAKWFSLVGLDTFSSPSNSTSFIIPDNHAIKGNLVLYQKASTTSSLAWERSHSSSFPLWKRSLLSFFLSRKRLFSATASSVASPLAAETLALRNAMISALQCGINALLIFSDSQILTNLVNSRGRHLEIAVLLNLLSALFTAVEFKFIPRLIINRADLVARQALCLMYQS
ncbi:hypothetical protein IGI04_034115 [Brassica rapa subsp. trilocularis]|nr:hypothetical protein IGI04_034115 [Brassica rapa subsp. trilocularis]CAG7860965.1 unnamed protein product [Brassica rapa]